MSRKALLGNITDQDLRLLRIFHAVVACGGFAAAELELNINRSTISRHIKDLETRLGVVLCRRGRGGFSLTPEGEQVLVAAQQMMAALEDFRHSVQDLGGGLQGQLVSALFDKTATNPACRIDHALRLFDEKAPAVRHEMHVVPINSIERGLIEGRYHLGVLPDHRPSASLEYHPLFAETMYLYCGDLHPLFSVPDGKLERRRVARSRYVGIGFHSPNMEASQRFRLLRDATAHDQEAIAQLILSGAYIGFLPDHYAATFTAAGRMRALLPEEFTYACRFSALLRRSPAPNPATRMFIECLLQAHA